MACQISFGLPEQASLRPECPFPSGGDDERLCGGSGGSCFWELGSFRADRRRRPTS
jgi:hypothetical protein